jgi:hypothetical protein
VISCLEDVQLVTTGHDQGHRDTHATESYSWFDLALFESVEAIKPRVVDGRPLIWRSHNNELRNKTATERYGLVFDSDHEILSLLEVSDPLQWESQHADLISNIGRKCNWYFGLRPLRQVGELRRKWLSPSPRCKQMYNPPISHITS